jgi:hypothetical protein
MNRGNIVRGFRSDLDNWHVGPPSRAYEWHPRTDRRRRLTPIAPRVLQTVRRQCGRSAERY